MLEEILKAIRTGTYEYYGIRIEDGIEYQVGDTAHDSRSWSDGEPTGETIDGTSCIGIRFNASEEEISAAIKLAGNYYGDSVYLIGSNEMEYGEDIGEYILKDAIVVTAF